MSTTPLSRRAEAAGLPESASRWWREPMMWLVVGGPLAVVVAGGATAAIAMHAPDAVVLNMPASTELRPAVQARNHAAAPLTAQDASTKR